MIKISYLSIHIFIVSSESPSILALFLNFSCIFSCTFYVFSYFLLFFSFILAVSLLLHYCCYFLFIFLFCWPRTPHPAPRPRVFGTPATWWVSLLMSVTPGPVYIKFFCRMWCFVSWSVIYSPFSSWNWSCSFFIAMELVIDGWTPLQSNVWKQSYENG